MTVLLLDISASMSQGTPRRIDALWQAVKTLHTPQSRWRVAVFSSRCRWSPVQAVPAPYGNTDLAEAFTEISTVAPTSVTLVTDGQPDDAEAAHVAGVALRCPIHILFAGDPQAFEALACCRNLCEAIKGMFGTEALILTAWSTVTSTMRKMLGTSTPPASATPHGSV